MTSAIADGRSVRASTATADAARADQGAAVVGEAAQPVDQGGPGGRMPGPHLAQQYEGGPLVAERGLLLGHRAPFGVLVLPVRASTGQLEARADVCAEDRDLGDAGGVLGLLE
jgi:hypothetical protein